MLYKWTFVFWIIIFWIISKVYENKDWITIGIIVSIFIATDSTLEKSIKFLDKRLGRLESIEEERKEKQDDLDEDNN